MIIFVALILLSTAFADDRLSQVLRSPKATLKLYNNFKDGEGLHYSGNEDRLRFRLFRKNAEFVADLQEHDLTAAHFGLNFFSSMTRDEKKQYLGLNMTGYRADTPTAPRIKSLRQIPAQKLWTNEEAVTEVKNQGSCGSCWTFGAVGGLETRYKVGSGVLRDFAEQEYLDCVYEKRPDRWNGCDGGWPDNAYTYSNDNGGRLAASVDYKYKQSDGRCLGRSKPDAMVAMKIRGFTLVGTTEDASIEALASGSLSVCFEATDYFQQYTSGIITDRTCRPEGVNHAVTAVGYTEDYVLVKNSWGKYWGDRGFVKFARNFDNCSLFKFASYPVLEATGEADNTPSDAATPYRPNEDNGPMPEPTTEPYPQCQDVYTMCYNYLHYCQMTEWALEYCARTCKLCEGGDDNDGDRCPAGTIRCGDGVCRHEHMC